MPKHGRNRHRIGAAAPRSPLPRATTGKVSAAQHLRYRWDNVLARGTWAIILWLGLISAAVIVFSALLLTITNQAFADGDSHSFRESTWQSLLRVVDPGTMADDVGWGVRLVSLMVTLTGIFLVSGLIGIIATGLDRKIEELRKGRSFVVERGHTVILGWSPRLFTLVSELVVANENHPGLAIVVLADRDKTEMEDEIRARVGSLGGTRLVCRSGEPANIADLGLVNIGAARSVVVLGQGEGVGDADVVKAVLAVRSDDGTLDRVPVVAELSDERTARVLEDACEGKVLTVVSAEIVARVTAQSCRQAGLSSVVQELLDFDGDEIYFADIPEVEGLTFAEAQLAFETSCLIGLRSADGAIRVNPAPDTVFAPGDRVIAISEDDDTVLFTGSVDVEPLSEVAPREVPRGREQMLVVGWNQLGPRILAELDRFVAPGSEARVLVDTALVGADELRVPRLDNFEVRFSPTTDEAEALATFAREHPFTSVTILGYRQGLTASEADARTLLTLLLLERGLDEAGHDHRPRVVTELLDSKDVELARITGADDFVVSDALGSLMMAQLSEHPELREVFRQIYTSSDSALHMDPATAYRGDGEASFAQIVATASRAGKVAIGWCRAGWDGEPHEVIVNPPKSHRVQLAPEDHVVVIGG